MEPRYYDRDCFESILASVLVNNSDRWISGVGPHQTYAAHKIDDALYVGGNIHINLIMRYGKQSVSWHSTTSRITRVDLTCVPPEAELTQIEHPDKPILVLKHEYEPKEEE